MLKVRPESNGVYGFAVSSGGINWEQWGLLRFCQIMAKTPKLLINPALGHLTMPQVGRNDVVQLHLTIRRTPRRANYTVSTVHAIFNFPEQSDQADQALSQVQSRVFPGRGGDRQGR
jgi:hypothetical protein